MTIPHTQVPDEAHSVVALARDILGADLVALHLHGSAASGGLRPQSDVDLLMILERRMTGAARARLLDGLLEASSRYPAEAGGRRCIELIAFLKHDLSPVPYPACATFIYGEWLRDDFESGIAPEPSSDPEFTLLLAQARQAAIPLYGPALDTAGPDVPKQHVRQALQDVVPSLLQNLAGDERNVLLTLARVWHTSETGLFISKDTAADWVMTRISRPAATVVAEASAAYRQNAAGPWEGEVAATQRTANELAAGALAVLRQSQGRSQAVTRRVL